MIIYAGIDGTSSEEDDPYKVTFKDSFVNRLGRKEIVPFDDCFYHRGPHTWGTETREFANLAYVWVKERWQSGAAKAIFLGGYSRGAAAVIEVAYWLKSDGIPVECLILFDAVDRSTPGPGGGVGGVFQNTPIASTVRCAIHPMRDIPSTLSRISFQRCGQTVENPAMPNPKGYFFTTHGGAGGTPWTSAVNPYTEEPRDTIWEYGEVNPTNVTPTQDAGGSWMVESWTFPFIRHAFYSCKQRLSQPAPGDGQHQYPGTGPGHHKPHYPGGGNGHHLPGQTPRYYVVQSGDWLSKIAIKFYGDMNKWHVIYDQPDNKKLIGPNPDLIKPGQKLVIP